MFSILKKDAMKSIKKKDWNEAIPLLQEIFKRQLHPPTESIYIIESTELEKKRKLKRAQDILEEGLGVYPDSKKIHIRLAKIYIQQYKWKKFYNFIRKKTFQPPLLNTIILLGQALQNNNQHNEANEVLNQGLKFYPNNLIILKELAEVAMSQNNWHPAVNYLKQIIKLQDLPSVNTYLKLSTSLFNLDKYDENEKLLEQAIAKFPADKKLLLEWAEQSERRQNWEVAIEKWESINKRLGEQAPVEALFSLSVVHQIIGNDKQSASILSECFNARSKELKKAYKEGYKKVILFDNGESRIEFYKKIKPVEKACITFDSVNIEWDEPPFGFKFLSQKDIDIIAVRRRTKTNYHQDLSKEDFYQSVNKLVKTYDRTIAYGFSLGGYSALYYGSTLNCEILSLSPRNPAHPIYGDKPIERDEFTHDLSHQDNSQVTPIIAYDPKNTIDNRYIEQELIFSYPNSKLMTFPYAGHRMSTFFLEIGILKDVIDHVLTGKEIPNYDRKLRLKSKHYMRVLGEQCLKRNKNKWALSLANQSLELSLNNKKAFILKINALKKLGAIEDAILSAKEAKQQFPDDESINLILTDLMNEFGQ